MKLSKRDVNLILQGLKNISTPCANLSEDDKPKIQKMLLVLNLVLVQKSKLINQLNNYMGSLTINLYGRKKHPRFYQLMESITQGVISTLKKIWQKTINFLSKYAQRANPTRDKEKGRLKCGLTPIIS